MTPAPGLLRGAFWAGLISLDITGFGPWMLTQPIASGPLFGWLMGQVNVGIIIGGIVQVVWMDVSPIGVGIPFDAAAVTILAVYWASSVPDCSLAQMMLALSVAVPFGYLFCLMDSYARRVNTLIIRRLESVPDPYLLTSLNLGIVAGLVWSFLRYFLFYALIMWGGDVFFAKVKAYPFPDWLLHGLELSAYLLPIAGLRVALELFLTEEPERRYRPFAGFKPKSP